MLALISANNAAYVAASVSAVSAKTNWFSPSSLSVEGTAVTSTYSASFKYALSLASSATKSLKKMLNNDLSESPRLIEPSYSVCVTSHTYGASKVFHTITATFPLLASEEKGKNTNCFMENIVILFCL